MEIQVESFHFETDNGNREILLERMVRIAQMNHERYTISSVREQISEGEFKVRSSVLNIPKLPLYTLEESGMRFELWDFGYTLKDYQDLFITNLTLVGEGKKFVLMLYGERGGNENNFVNWGWVEETEIGKNIILKEKSKVPQAVQEP